MANSPAHRHKPLALALLGCAVWLSCPVHAATPITIVEVTPLSFGRFAAGTGGTLRVSLNSTASATGGVYVPTASVVTAASFHIAGDADLVFAVSLPPDGTAALSGTGSDMPLSAFVSTGDGLGQLSASGTQTIRVGATLQVGNGQPAGAYSGNYSVIVEYN